MMLLCSTAGAVVLTRLNSDSTDLLGWLGQFLYWGSHVAIGLLLASLTLDLFVRRLRVVKPRVSHVLGAGVVAAMLFTPVALLMDQLLQSSAPTSTHPGTIEVFQWPQALFMEFVELLPLFVGMWMLVQVPLLLPTSTPPSEPAQPDTPTQDTDLQSQNNLAKKLPSALGSDIFCIEADLNYVHVTTGLGKTMLLYSLRQAAEELGEQGLLIHRSVWVSKAAVAGVKKRGTQLMVELKNGRTFQVSRRRQRAVLDAFGSHYRAGAGYTQSW